MNVRGERILIFGDSLTAHTDAAPSIWEVNAGSQRVTSAPGDLLASLLAEQGAAAVRTNARVSRSARNFWEREAAQAILTADVAWRPTKVVIMLGTNDVGMDPVRVRQGLEALQNIYRAAGAEVWAIGPFHSSKDPAKVEAVVQIMRGVFGLRFLDGRPYSELAQRASDGLHYTPAGARTLALALADALLSKMGPAQVVHTAAFGLLGMAAAVGLGLWYLRRERPMLDGPTPPLEVVNGRRYLGSPNELVRQGFVPIPCKSGYDEKGLARCWGKPIDAEAVELDGAEDDDDEDFAPDAGTDDWFARLQAKTAARHKPVVDALTRHPAVFARQGDRRLLFIRSAEMSNPEEGAERVTMFDEDGPIGHVTRATAAKVAQEIARDWNLTDLEPADDEAVMAFTSTDRFAEGAARVAAVQRANAGLKR